MVRHYAKIIGAAVYLTVRVQIPLREGQNFIYKEKVILVVTS